MQKKFEKVFGIIFAVISTAFALGFVLYSTIAHVNNVLNFAVGQWLIVAYIIFVVLYAIAYYIAYKQMRIAANKIEDKIDNELLEK